MLLLVAPSRGRSLLSFRGARGKDLQISGILHDVVISKPSNHGLKNMSDLDLSDATRRVSTREGDNREDHTP
jgi:hypothetical protein